VRLAPGTLRHATIVLSQLLEFSGPADETLSRYFRAERQLGQQERGFIAEAVFAVLRRRRSLEAAAGSAAPEALVVAAAMRVLGLSLRSLDGLVDPRLAERIRSCRIAEMPQAVRADLPDWLWERLGADHGEHEAERIAHGMLNPAPLDLRVNLARTSREDVCARLAGRPAPGGEAGDQPPSAVPRRPGGSAG
jgi:16S rRNA (cytosine967-C5)-methyltransferase